jgi:hypothetical protein
MSEILTDAAFTNLEITESLFFRDRTFIDRERNINAKTVTCDTISCKNIHIQDGVVDNAQAFLNLPNTREFETSTTTKLLDFNEPTGGANATCVGGMYNEAVGDASVTVGGAENQAIGENAVAMGVSAIARHSNSFVWNPDKEVPLESTKEAQCVLGSEGGLLFKLPKSSDIQTHMVPEGFACWCWDEKRQTLMLKTKQQNTMYKSSLDTLEHELTVGLSAANDRVEFTLNNPDTY